MTNAVLVKGALPGVDNACDKLIVSGRKANHIRGIAVNYKIVYLH